MEFINPNKHLVLKGVHPSPLSASRGFFGCKHFSKTNEYLISKNLSPINWQIDA
jgi:uracil-DNA glycosylase